MRFNPPSNIDELAERLEDFLAIAGGARWWKRVDQLSEEGRQSPFLAKIMADHHWLELELSTQMSLLQDKGHLRRDEVLLESMAALMFAGMTVETHRRLTDRGQKNLEGRLRDALNTGFAGLYLELDTARGLLDEGFDVEFPDLEQDASYDIRFHRTGTVGELECKSLSADAGRKIHRRDFYRLMHALAPLLSSYAEGSQRTILLITFTDRMAGSDEKRNVLVASAARALDAPVGAELNDDGFTIARRPYEELADTMILDRGALYAACSEVYGPNCHVAGAMTEECGCLVICRSSREDDHSKPQLLALKKAASQLTGDNPAFVAIQFEDIAPADLALSHVRRSAALLANYVFHSRPHLAAVHHTAYGGLHASGGELGKPAFVVWNSRYSDSADGLPFRKGPSNIEFARMLGVDPARSDPDGEFIRIV